MIAKREAMINTLEMSRLYKNQWVVLDRNRNVLDCAPQLEILWVKYSAILEKITFYFAAAA